MGFLLTGTLLLSVNFLLLCTGTQAAHDWFYGEEANWPELCQVGTRQSPIALSTDVAVIKEFSTIQFENYRNEFDARLKNNGHSAELRLKPTEDVPQVLGGNLPEVYSLDHLHFHWQSEHTIDGYRYPLEMHAVHYATTYGNLSEALKHKNGVAVFGVMFDLSPDEDEDLEPLIELLDKISNHIEEQQDIKISVHDFLPRDMAGYYRYEGSLTTPGCTEGLVWTVFTDTVPISRKQVQMFQHLQTTQKTKLMTNYRSLQALNDRTVYIRVSPIRDSADKSQISFGLFISISLIIYYFNL